MRRQGVALRGATVVLSAMLLAACSGSDVDAEPGFSATGSATTGATSIPASTIDPKAQPAVAAYEAFTKAARNAQRHPFGLKDKIPPGADFAKHAFDPVAGEYAAYILGLANQGAEYRGPSPRLNVRVKSVELEAKPWPTVILTDCQTDSDQWRLYDRTTGSVQPRATPSVSPPYRITVTVILYKNHWGAQKLTSDPSRTCTP